MVKGRKRHLFIWKFSTIVAGPWLKRKFNFHPEPADIKAPYLVLANHNTDFDPFLVGLSFREQMYFVASEHVFRWGIVSKLLRWFYDPISRLKGRTASSTVMTILRRLKEGINVCIFAEGEKSWNGETCEISEATAKLARSCGATLVTYRLEGGYFSAPRWSKKTRRGKMRGGVVGVYEPDKLNAMSLDELKEVLRRDLYENAYTRQESENIPFIGKGLAEHLETALCLCPRCGAVGLMRSEGDRFFCTGCGAETRYTRLGFFEGGDFKTVLDWDRWQTSELQRLVLASGTSAVYTDENIILKELSDEFGEKELGRGRLALYRDRVECAGEVWSMKDISGMALHGRVGMNLAVGKKNYELVPEGLCCMRKYLTAYNTLKGELTWIFHPQTTRSGT